jgi:uncharacterized membrane protein YbhN (UPF0104 family)
MISRSHVLELLGRLKPSARTKKIAIVIIIIATLVIFGLYLRDHPKLIGTLTSLSPLTLLILSIGYFLVTLVNSFVLFYSLRLLSKRTSLFDNFVLTGYSSIVNFFGPLQSGPGFRAVYLKRKYGVKLRSFFAATVIFYGFFAAINTLILVIAALHKFQSNFSFYILLIVSVATSGALVSLAYKKSARFRSVVHAVKLTSINFWFIGVGALLLTAATAGIYFFELQQVGSGVSITQTIVYTAAADLSLFVALTPGAIGFRESFLFFSQQLHGIDTTTIIGASVIDRAFYVIFLLVLFLVLLAINSKKRLSVFKTKVDK